MKLPVNWSIGQWPLSLKLVSLQVENVLKGFSDVREISFYRYEWCGSYIRNGTPEVAGISAGSRSIYFLRMDNNYLRAFNDYTYTHLRLWSGRHENSEIQGDSIVERLIWLMISPGHDMNGEEFAETLRMQVLYGDGLAPENRTFRHILNLLDHSDALVRAGACLAIAWNFSGRYSCLEQPYTLGRSYRPRRFRSANPIPWLPDVETHRWSESDRWDRRN
jgi:hypothetical protein